MLARHIESLNSAKEKNKKHKTFGKTANIYLYIKRPKRTSGRHIHPEGTKSAKNSRKASHHDDPLLFGSHFTSFRPK